MTANASAALRATRLRVLTGEAERLDGERRRIDAVRRQLEAACSRDLGHLVPLRGPQLLAELDRAEGRAIG